MLYFNYAAVDPVLTNEKCSFWHFRWDANSDIKMEALTNYMKGVPDIKKVYLINQDYSFGQSVRTQAKAMLGAKRPDIQIVGDELHPLLKITDFSPYIAKIKASGADTVVTGNWGQDIALLLKAAADAGLQVNWYTYYAGGTGGPTAVKQAGLNHQVFQISEGFANVDHKASQDFEKAFRAKYDIERLVSARGQPDADVRRRRREGQVARSGEGGAGAGRHEVRGVQRRRRLHAQGRPSVLPADVHLLVRRPQREGAVRRRKDRLGLEGWSPRSTPRRPCCRPPARWNGRKLDRDALSLPRLRGEGRGEGAPPTRTRVVETPPHPDRCASRPRPARGERCRPLRSHAAPCSN